VRLILAGHGRARAFGSQESKLSVAGALGVRPTQKVLLGVRQSRRSIVRQGLTIEGEAAWRVLLDV